MNRKQRHDVVVCGQEGDFTYTAAKAYDFDDGRNYATFDGEWVTEEEATAHAAKADHTVVIADHSAAMALEAAGFANAYDWNWEQLRATLLRVEEFVKPEDVRGDSMGEQLLRWVFFRVRHGADVQIAEVLR